MGGSMVDKKNKKLKLYVWRDFCPSWSGGLAFAIAYDEEDAKKLVEKSLGMTPSCWGELTVYPLTRKIAESVSGGD
jgi:hypothetical protein